MNKRWLTILLLVSIAFNLAVLGSFVFIRIYMGKLGCPPPPPHNEKGGRFMPPPMLEKMREDTEFLEIKKDLDVKRRELMTELAKDPIDEPLINNLLSETYLAQNAFEKKMSEKLIELRKSMTAEEAQEYFSKRAEFIRQPHFNRDKFDRKTHRRSK